ncbi:hypothetical protein Tco_0550169 [Tanacetum coccineum]
MVPRKILTRSGPILLNTARQSHFNAVRTNRVNAVKASACWVWRPIKPNSASITLKRYDYVDGNPETELEDSVRLNSPEDKKPLTRYSLSYSIVRNPWSWLIPLSRGSFDVLMGMDRLSKRKFGIVCHEKVVRILLEGNEILRVHGERTQGVVKTLMNTKVGESKLSDISVVRDFIDVFLEDLSMTTTTTSGVPHRFGSWNDVMGDALSRKERVKSRRVRGMILAAQSEAFKQENVLAERLHGLDQQMERKGDESLYFMDRIWVLLVGSVMDEAHASSLRYLSENEIESPWILSLNFQGQSSEYDVNWVMEWNSGDDQLRLRWMIYLVVLADAAESVRYAIGFEYCLASSIRWTNGTYESNFGRYNEGMC